VNIYPVCGLLGPFKIQDIELAGEELLICSLYFFVANASLIVVDSFPGTALGMHIVAYFLIIFLKQILPIALLSIDLLEPSQYTHPSVDALGTRPRQSTVMNLLKQTCQALYGVTL